MDIFVYTKAADLRQSCATTLTDLSALITALADPSTSTNQATLDRIAAQFAQLVYGDTEPLSIRFCTDASGTAPSWAGVEGYTVEVTLGRPTEDGRSRMTATTSFTYASNTYTGSLPLVGQPLQVWVRDNPRGGPLTLQIRVVGPTGTVETFAVPHLQVLGAVPSVGTQPSTPIPYATFTEVQAAQEAAAQSAAAAAQSAAEADGLGGLTWLSTGGRTSAEQAVEDLGAQPASSLLSSIDAFSGAWIAGHRYNARVGLDYVSGGFSTTFTLFVLSPRKLPAGRVKELTLACSGSGDFAVVLLRPNADGTASVVESAALNSSGSGVKTFVAGVDFPAWELDGMLQIGIQTGTSGAPGLRYASSGEGYSFFVGTASGTFSLSNTAAGEIYYAVTVAADEARSGGATLESVAGFSCLPAGWSNGGSTWTFSSASRSATSGATGLSNQLRSGARFGLDARTLRWEFSLGSGSSIAAFLTNPIEGGINAGSLVRVNAADQLLEIYGAYTGSNTPALVTSTAAVITSGTRYVLEWTKSGRSFTVALKTRGGTTVATLTRTATPWGYSTYPSFGYDQGAMQGAPGVAAIAGAVTVYELEHRANVRVRPRLMIIGDSITEGFAVTDAQKWSALLAAQIGQYEVCSSGIGGATTTSVLGRLASELLAIRPQNVIIFLGTNADASFATNIVTLAYSAHRAGANVYVCTVPTSSTHTATVNGMAAWVRKIALDLALTNSGAGSGVVAALYAGTDAGGGAFNDSLHPNADGHAAMAARVLADAPELASVFPAP